MFTISNIYVYISTHTNLSLYLHTYQIKAAISKVRQELETGYGGPLSDDMLNEDSPRERVKRGFTAQSPTSVGNSYHESTALTGGSSALTPIDLNVPIGRSRANSFDSSISFDTRLSAVTGVLGDEDASLSLRLSDFGMYLYMNVYLHICAIYLLYDYIL